MRADVTFPAGSAARLGALIGLLALAACSSFMGGADPAAPTAIGKNLVGEDCTTYAGKLADAPPIGSRMQIVQCGSWQYPSARIFELPGRSGDALAALVAGNPWRSFIDGRMSCDQGQPTTILAGDPAIMLGCKLRNGGWPFVALAARVDGKTFLADGIPAALPAIELAIRFVASGAAPQPADKSTGQSAAVERLQAQLRGRMFGSGDLKNYFELLQRGQYYDTTLDFASAEADYRDALALHERILGADNAEGAEPMMSLALELSNEGRFAEADPLFQRAAQLSEQTSPALRARLVSYRAIDDANHGRRADALALARRATGMRQQIRASLGAGSTAGAGLPSDASVLYDPVAEAALVDIVQSRFIEASMLLRNQQPGDARTVAASALSELGRVRIRPEWWLPRLYELDADIDSAVGERAQAVSALTLATVAWPKIFRQSRPEGLTYFALGENLGAEGQTEAALAAFRKGAAIISQAGGGLNFAQVRPYLDAALAEADRHPEQRDTLMAEVFQAAQLVRGSVTSRTISLAAARLSSSSKPVGAVIRKKQDAERVRDGLLEDYNRMAAAPPDLQDKDGLEKLRQRIEDADKESAALDEQVQSAAAGYNQLLEVPVDAAKTLALLRPKEVLVAFLLGEPRSFAFVLKDGKIAVHPLQTTEAEVAKMVRTLRVGVAVTADGKVPAFDLKLAHALYVKLFGPFEASLVGTDHMVVAAAGPLLSLPLGVLVTREPASQSYKTAAWLVRSETISTVTSVRSFVDLRAIAQPSKAKKAFIGFGGFIPPKITPANAGVPARCVEDYKQLASLGALPGTVAELRSVGGILAGPAAVIRIGHDFTKAAVIAAGLDQYRVVYFATHALLPTDLECRPEPTLLASLPLGSNDVAQMFLDNKDVMELNLDADLVVLSACNTDGPDGQSAGESLSGLARSFFYSGARAILLTHWEAEDEATAYLMKQTFATLTAQVAETPADALRAAQLTMIDKAGAGLHDYWSHPIFWAPFALIGDGGRPWQGAAVAMGAPPAVR